MKNKPKNDKKIYLIFIAAMIIFYGTGYLLGKFAAKAEDSGSILQLLASVKNSLITAVPPFFPVLAIISFIILLVLYISCKKMYKKLQENPDDDDLWDSLEDSLNRPMILANVMQIVNLFFFGCFLYIVESAGYGKDGGFETVIIITDILLIVLIFVAGILIQKGVIDIEKKLNPEKQGNVFDFKFNEVWLSSCDEAEKLILYKATWQAFKNTQIVCIILLVLSILGMLAFQTGIYPMLCICIIWMVNSLSYMLKAAKLEKRLKH